MDVTVFNGGDAKLSEDDGAIRRRSAANENEVLLRWVRHRPCGI